ncbi:hypothetical protein Pla175_39050 [Pirellulimonas nuda]|uniref:Uncharacterized protein n=1 Tax=Pirellulimonas nuda TaxID=2528009 RepID=A0A518DG98_9BACT|nr:hypothetical protein Pla175_39050 [Pirellulimonas nuda]
MFGGIEDVLRAVSENSPTKRQTAPFIKGPLPLLWVNTAASLPGKALAVGLALWWRFGLTGDNPVKLTMDHCQRFGIKSRNGRKAAINALKGAGLLEVELSSTKAPRVTILDAGKPVLPRTTKASRSQSNSCPPQEETTQLLHDPHIPP